MQKILVSACLLGAPVRYDGRAKPLAEPLLARWQAEARLVALCPELAGGLPVPRPPAEIVGLAPLVIRTEAGEDVTEAFRRGAEAALALCQREGIAFALLKEGSPSCGSRRVRDGRFGGASRPGAGLTARLLRAHGIAVYGEDQLDALAQALAARED